MEELITGHRVQLIGTAIALAAFAGLRTILRWLVRNAVFKIVLIRLRDVHPLTVRISVLLKSPFAIASSHRN